MKTNEHFSEAAKLYAANIDVVKQMKDIYEAELKAFVERVIGRVEMLVRPTKVCRMKKQPVVLWLGEDEEKESKEKGACLWFDTIHFPEIVNKGQFTITVWTDSDEDRRWFPRLVAHPDFVPSSNIGGKHFDVRIDLGTDDGVELAAARLAKMLQAIDAASKG